jgi:uncharacterized protein (DUF1501 family)
VIPVTAILGVLLIVVGMAFFALGFSSAKNKRVSYGALVLIIIGLALTIYFGVMS